MRFIDFAILLVVIAMAAGVFIRMQHPDLVSSRLTDLSRREDARIEVAIPPPWRRPPLSMLPKDGDAQAEERDSAVFRGIVDTDSYPTAAFDLHARIDPEGRRWFNYGELIPGASFNFQTDSYRMEGIILTVSPR